MHCHAKETTMCHASLALETRRVQSKQEVEAVVEPIVKFEPKKKIYRNQEFFVNCCRPASTSAAKEQWRGMSATDREPYEKACALHNDKLRQESRDS
jgi:hypothetical protein